MSDWIEIPKKGAKEKVPADGVMVAMTKTPGRGACYLRVLLGSAVVARLGWTAETALRLQWTAGGALKLRIDEAPSGDANTYALRQPQKSLHRRLTVSALPPRVDRTRPLAPRTATHEVILERASAARGLAVLILTLPQELVARGDRHQAA